MKVFSWIWGLVPVKAQVWVAIAFVLAAIGGIGLAVYKIDKKGYDRCQAEHAAAAEKQKSEARVDIIDSGKKYEDVKRDVRSTPGSNDPVGPRVTRAIDLLP